MDHSGIYVWAAYGITVVMIALVAAWTCIRHSRTARQVEVFLQKQQCLADRKQRSTAAPSVSTHPVSASCQVKPMVEG